MKPQSIVPKTGSPEVTEGRGVTRRSFLELAFGAITMLPAVVGGGFALTLSPEDAYAADTMPTTQVIVVKGWETGICVVDLTDGKRLPVPDAEVVLTTIGTSKQKLSVTGRTDQSGVFILDMKKLGKPKKDASGTEVYEAQVSIRVRKDGYRVFEVGWFSLKGGNGFEIPTRKVGDEAAYPYRATFNDWDILYTNNEFVVTPANDSDFDLVTCFVAKTSSERIKAELVHIKSPTEKIRIDEAEAGVYYDGVLQCYVCRVKMRRPFLLTNHHYGLKPGGKYEIWYELGSTLYKVPLQLSLVACPTGISAPFSKKMTLSPFGDETMKLQVTFPQWVPLFGGQKIVIWKPDLPIDVCFDPLGYLRVAGHIPLWGYKSKDGVEDKEYWKGFARRNVADEYKSQWDKLKKMGASGDSIDKMMKGLKDPLKATHEFSRTVQWSIMIEVLAAGKWNVDSGAFRGKLEAGVIFTLAFSHAMQIWAGPVPIVTQFDLNLYAGLHFGLGFALPYNADTDVDSLAKAFQFDYPSTGIKLTIRIAPALSIGLGVKGVASVSIQGVLAFTFLVQLIGPRPTGGKETYPRLIVGLRATVNVVLQALFFTMPIKIWENEEPNLYDSWDPSKLYANAQQMDEGMLAAQASRSAFAWFRDNEPRPMELGDELVEFEVASFKDSAYDYLVCVEGDDPDDISFMVAGVGPVEDLTTVFGPAGSYHGLHTEFDAEECTTEDGMSYRVISLELVPDDPVPVQPTVLTGDDEPSAPDSTGQPVAFAAMADGGVGQDEQSVDDAWAAEAVTAADGHAAAEGGSGQDTQQPMGYEAMADDAAAPVEDAWGLEDYDWPVDAKEMADEFTPVADGHRYQAGPIQEMEDYLRLNTNVGIQPGDKQCIAQNVISDPRSKVVSLCGVPVMLRIASVNFAPRTGDNASRGSGIRTRIIGQRLRTTEFPAGPLCVFDFESGIVVGTTRTAKGAKPVYLDRTDIWDYDFDVKVMSVRRKIGADVVNEVVLQFFVISGKRSDNNSFGQAATDLYLTHVAFLIGGVNDDGRLEFVRRQSVGVQASQLNFGNGNETYRFHNFSCPHIEMVADAKRTRRGGRVNPRVSCTFLDRAVTHPDKVLSDDTNDVRISVGFIIDSFYADAVDKGSRKPNMRFFDLREMTREHQDATVYDLACSRRVQEGEGGWFAITLRGATKVYHYLLSTSKFAEQEKEILYAKFWYESALDDFVDEEEGHDLLRLVDWPGHQDKFLASVDGKLKEVTFSGMMTGNPVPSYREVGPSNFSISAFGVDPTGNMLFWPAVREGALGHSYDTSGDFENPVPSDGVEINEHLIMACRLRDGKFSDPFVLAEVDYDIDDLCITNVSKRGMSFVSTDIVDVDTGKGNIYHTTIPFVSCANIISFACASDYISPGVSATFHVTVRNDGNTFIKGFDVRLYEKGQKNHVSWSSLTFSADTILESSFNPMENGKLKGVEDDYTLAPGKTSIYQVSINIPSTWAGAKDVWLDASNVKWASPGEFRTQASIEPMLATMAEGDDEEEFEIYDGDPQASYAFDDSEAIEYVVGTHEIDFEAYYEEDAGRPYDVLEVEGEAVFFDEDDYDDISDEESGESPEDDGRDDYDVQLSDAPISLRAASEEAIPAEKVPGYYPSQDQSPSSQTPSGQTPTAGSGTSSILYPEGRAYAYQTPAWGPGRTYARQTSDWGQGSSPSGSVTSGQTSVTQTPSGQTGASGQTSTVGQTPATGSTAAVQTTAGQTPATGSSTVVQTPAAQTATVGQRLPGTGDAASLGNGIATALGAAGAAFMMYSARRVANENAAEKRDGDEEE